MPHPKPHRLLHWLVLLQLLHHHLHGSCASSTTPSPITTPITVLTNCSRDLLQIDFDVGKPFRGVLFAKDFLDECRTRGNNTANVQLIIPTSGCGVRSEPRADGTIELSVRLVLQMDGKLRQSSDMERVAKCSLPPAVMAMNIQTGVEEADEKTTNRSGRTRFSGAKNAPRVRVWLELGGAGGAGVVEVGQSTTLGVRAVLPGNVGVRVVDCAALDGLGEASQKLLDERGCPIDEQVMPALLTRLRPAEEGWSKPNDDDLVEKLFTSTFPAFKFPDRERLHVSCGVQLCQGKCPNVNCRVSEPFILPIDQQLARIEIFNSLAVTAPQIEIDRLRHNARYNISVEEGIPRVRSLRSEGTLCMSTSKLALAFCVLGLIFLIAVVVAVCCLLRARSKNNNQPPTIATSTSIFSSSSSSQSRFGGKFIMPRYGGNATLPYGRVY